MNGMVIVIVGKDTTFVNLPLARICARTAFVLYISDNERQVVRRP